MGKKNSLQEFNRLRKQAEKALAAQAAKVATQNRRVAQYFNLVYGPARS